MQNFSSQAILLRRIDYGDNDLIVTLFTPLAGKLTVIAKSAKKSKKRFPGILEHFSLLSVVYSKNQRQQLPILKEAALEDAFIHIRSDIRKTGYVGYWVELINFWLPEGKEQADLYYLLKEVLCALDKGAVSVQMLSVYFQMKFLMFAGFMPNLESCCLCRTEADGLRQKCLTVSLKDGGLVCCNCGSVDNPGHKFTFSRGTLKQLNWIAQRDLGTAARVRFSTRALQEALDFLEAFVPYHVGKVPKSLEFIRQLDYGK